MLASSPGPFRVGKQAPKRCGACPRRRGHTATPWATRGAQYDAGCTWGIPDHAPLHRVTSIDVPVFAANGDGGPMILPAFLCQHHAEVAADVEAFLTVHHNAYPLYAIQVRLTV
jgi:hypothetical protein